MTMTDSLAEDIDDLTRQVWQSVFDLDLAPEEPGATPDVHASVQIIGGWHGAVSVRLTGDLARIVASSMFEMPDDDLTRDEIDDAVGEVANMIGGNIKSLLPGPSQLSLPTVGFGDEPPHFPGTVLAEHVAYTIAGQPFVVDVHAGPIEPEVGSEEVLP